MIQHPGDAFGRQHDFSSSVYLILRINATIVFVCARGGKYKYRDSPELIGIYWNARREKRETCSIAHAVVL
jgi:hypothetical protein